MNYLKVLNKFKINLSNLTLMERNFALLIVVFLSYQDFLNEWIWSPFWTIYVLLAILFADLCSGLALSLKRGEGFSTKKFTTWILTCFGFFFVLGVTFNFPKINEALFFPTLSPLLVVVSRCFYLLMLFNTLASTGKNMVLVGALKGNIGLFFLRYIDTYKNKAEDVLTKQFQEIGSDNNK